ncbi:MAG: 4Fe-4S binding protein [archaeon]
MPKVSIDYKKCDGCGTCIEVCAVNVFEKRKDKTVVARQGDCLLCLSCVDQCPKKAITVKED